MILSVLFRLYGVRMFENEATCSRHIARLACLVVCLLFYYSRLIYYITIIEPTRGRFFALAILIFYATTIISHHTFWRRSRTIENYAIQLIDAMPPSKRRLLLHKLLTQVKLAWIISVLLDFATELVTWVKLGRREYFYLYFWFLPSDQPITGYHDFVSFTMAVLWSVFVSGWYNLSVIFCWFMMFILQTSNHFFFRQVSMLRNCNYHAARAAYRRRCLLVAHFDLVLSFLPLYWITVMFSESTSIIFNIRYGIYNATTNSLTTGLVFLMLIIRSLPVVYLVLCNSRFNDRIQLAVHACLLTISAQTKCDLIAQQLSLELQLNKSHLLSLSGWSLFMFDKTLLLNLSAAVISFTVLFLQIIES